MDTKTKTAIKQIQNELQEYMNEHIVGVKYTTENTLLEVIGIATQRMHDRFPEYEIEAINPRIEGKNIVWDGWLFTSIGD